MTDQPHFRVAIIGAGYAGISAAVTLAESGIRPTIFEAGKVLGGRARRIEYRGEVLDNGQHILSGAYSELLRLMTLTGVPDTACKRVPLTLSFPPHFSMTAPRWIAPLHLACALLTAKGLDMSERIAAIRFMQSLKRDRFAVDAAMTVSTLLAVHRQPEKLIRFLWQPLTISALNTPLESASAQVFVNVLRDALASTREASDLLLPQVDLSELFPETASRWLSRQGADMRPATRVRAVLSEGTRFHVQTDGGGTDKANPESLFDAVIVAIGPHQFESMALPQGCLPTAPFSYEPIVTVYFKFDSRVRLPEAMLGQATGVAQWFFDRRQLAANPKVQAADDGLIAAVISASGTHEDCSQEELAAKVCAELVAHTGAIPSPAWHKVITERFATFACTPKMQQYRPANLTATPGLFLAGDYTAGDYPGTLEGAVRSGINAARHATAIHSTAKQT